jgi:hypothetical protein
VIRGREGWTTFTVITPVRRSESGCNRNQGEPGLSDSQSEVVSKDATGTATKGERTLLATTAALSTRFRGRGCSPCKQQAEEMLDPKSSPQGRNDASTTPTTPRSPVAMIPAFDRGWCAWFARIPCCYYRFFHFHSLVFCTAILFLPHNPFIHRLHSFILITAIALFPDRRSLDCSFDFCYWHRHERRIWNSGGGAGYGHWFGCIGVIVQNGRQI